MMMTDYNNNNNSNNFIIHVLNQHADIRWSHTAGHEPLVIQSVPSVVFIHCNINAFNLLLTNFKHTAPLLHG